MPGPERRSPSGFTLIELLIVITVVAIMAVALIPAMDPQFQDQVDSAAQIVAADLGYARSLAVTNASTYRVTFDVANNGYVLEHCGLNAALNTLPSSPMRNPTDPPTQQIVRLDKLPRLGVPVSLAQVVCVGTSLEPVAKVEFDSLGRTIDTRPTLVVLTVGQGTQKHRALVVVNPVTGLTTVGSTVERISSVIPATMVTAVNALGK